MQILKRLKQRLFARFVVVASFDGQVAKHYAHTWNEAMEWACCYPVRDSVEVYELVGGMQAVVPFASRAIV